MNEFKDMLKYLRNRENLSQSELASKLAVSKSTISMYEVGKRNPDFETLETIADLFNVDMNFLLGKESDNKAKDIPFTIAAHFDGDEFTEDELEDIADYIEFVKNKRK